MKLNWGHGIVIFFGVFISLAVIFIIFSLKQNNDLVEKDYYRKGADYTAQMIINQRSEVYKDSVDLLVSDNYMLVELASTIVEGADSLNLFFFRPSDERLDNQFKTSLVNETIEIALSNFIHGRYIVQLGWNLDGEEYMLKRDVFIP